jgi:ElaB/YqjD/DUF883 family membrane-anchored ribosome-binding protein
MTDEIDPKIPSARQVRPDPDPTLLTTQSLLREIANLKELLISKSETIESRLETRLNNVEKRLDHKYVETAADIGHLRDLHEEKFQAIGKLSDQSRQDNQTRIDAAFKSAKDAADKTEDSFTKQIDSLGLRNEAANKATNEKIDRLTSRLDTGEGKSRGAGDLWGYIVAGIGLAVAIAAIVLHH